MNRRSCNHPFPTLLLSSRQARKWLVYGSVASAFSILAIASIPSASGQAPGTTAPPPITPSVAQPPIDRPILNLGSQGEPVRELQAMLKLLGYYSGAVDGLYQQDTAIAVAAFQRAAGLPSDGSVNAATWNRLLPPAVSQANPTLSPANASPFPSPSVSPLPSPAPTPFPSPSISPTPAPSPTTTAPSPASPTPNSSPAPTPTPTPAGNTAAPRPAASPTSDRPQFVELPTLRVGMRGSAIVRLQERLRTLGFFNGVIDGIFGQETEAAVQAFQRRNRLDPDGIVGSATWTALLQ